MCARPISAPCLWFLFICRQRVPTPLSLFAACSTTKARALWAVKDAARTLVFDTLAAPGGIAVNAGGVIFVTAVTFGPPGGPVLALNG